MGHRFVGVLRSGPPASISSGNQRVDLRVVLPPIPVRCVIVVVPLFPFHVVAMRLVLPLDVVCGFARPPCVHLPAHCASCGQERNRQHGSKQEAVQFPHLETPFHLPEQDATGTGRVARQPNLVYCLHGRRMIRSIWRLSNMHLPCHRRSAIFFAACALAATANSAHAGPLPPCIDATLSANGNILVVNELTYDDPNESHMRHATGSAFRVLQHYVEVNEGLRMNGPDAHFAGPLWSLVLTNSDRDFIACPYSLVTNDGEYLILVRGGPIGRDVLSIYRRRDHPGQPFGGPGPDHGVLVRHIPLTDLWAPELIPGVQTDHTPAWFAGGSFAFTADNRTLIHTTRWGRTLQISLETGKVTGM